MMNILLQSTDSALINRVASLDGNIKVIDKSIKFEQMSELGKDAEVLLLDFLPTESVVALDLPVIVLATGYDKFDEFEAAKLGVTGYISSAVAMEQIQNAVTCVVAGQVWMSRETIAKVFDGFSKMIEDIQKAG